MASNGGGRIILTSSIASTWAAGQGFSSYGVSKSAVNRLAEHVHDEFSDKGVQCFAVYVSCL